MILQLKEVMKLKAITSIELAEKVGVSKATVSYWINGKVFPSPDTIEKIALALNVPIWRLFGEPAGYDKENKISCPHCGKEIHVEIITK